MLAEPAAATPVLPSATSPLAPGPLLAIGDEALLVQVAPQAGGRIAQIRHCGVPQLLGPDDGNPAMIAWGSYPMVPWAGRVRDAGFEFEGRRRTLVANLGAHAIHGLGFALPWQVDGHDARTLDLSLDLPHDERWPFGGSVRQRIEVDGNRLRLRLSLRAGESAMPAVIGWHPWFRKPDRLVFAPERAYARDRHGIATLPLGAIPAGPWDHCFINRQPVVLERDGVQLRLTSDCIHWVVYDQPENATCVEPQSGPPDAFNLEPETLLPGEVLERWYQMEWT